MSSRLESCLPLADGTAAVESPRRTPYYGWVMLPLSMAALVASAPGQTFGVSIFNEPMRRSLELSHAQLAAAYMLGTLLGALPIAYIGSCMDRYGLRRSMLLVVTLFSAACLLTSLVQGWLMLVAAFWLLRMLGPGALSFLSGNTLAFWFDRRLGMVEGIRQLGMASAMALIPALNLWLVTHYGWRGAYAILGVVVWLTLYPTFTFLFYDRPQQLGQHIDGVRGGKHDETGAANVWREGLELDEVLRTASFWIVTCGTALFGLIHTGVFFCLMPIFQERGLSQDDVAATLVLFAACLAAMQLVGGVLADRMRASALLAMGQVGLAAAMLLLYAAQGSVWALAAGAVMGASQGLYFGVVHPLWARYFGRRHLGKIRGVLTTVNVALSSMGPLLAGTIRDLDGSFTLALMLFALAPLPVAIASLFVCPPRRRHVPLVEAPAPRSVG